MTTEIILSYPSWWLLLCITGGFALAWLLYRKHPFDTEQKQLRWLVTALFVIRGVVLSVLAFLLLSPLLRISERLLEKPVVIIAVDNSQSLLSGADSAKVREDLPQRIEMLKNELSEFDTRIVLMGERVREDEKIDFSDRITNISELISNVEQRYENRNLGAVIIASDGVYNQGNNPQYTVKSLKAPVYTIAIGDTTVRKDALINTVRHNKIAYLGNTFPLIAEIEARELEGRNCLFTVEQDGKKLYETRLTFTNKRFISQLEVRLKAEKTGMAQYSLKLQALNGEATFKNNVRNIFIEVLDARNKVVIAARAPHPDIAALKQAIESNENYEVVVYYPALGGNKPELNKANLLIMHELPDQQKGNDLLLEAEELALPLLFINGLMTEHRLFNTHSGGITLQVSRKDNNEVLPSLNPDFSLFNLEDKTSNTLRKMPPLLAPYGTYSAVDPMHTLAYQQIGNIRTKDPLIVFGQTAERKIGIIFGTGVWRWRLYDYEINGDHVAVDELLSRIILYLAVKSDKRPFRVNALKSSYLENERVVFEAEVYNESYQLVNEADVNFMLIDEKGKQYNYTFGRTGNAYYLDAGFLKPGRYNYNAETRVGGKLLQVSGRFIVMPLETELLHTTADHNLLYNLASSNGGRMYYADQLGQLAEELKKREELKPVSYYKTGLEDLINNKWLFFFLLLLLVIEWFARKLNGAY